MRTSILAVGLGSVIACCSMSACGGSSGGASVSTTAAGSSGVTSSASSGGASALAAEAQSQATGDIPDTQVFLTFHDPTAGYSMHYPEGWAQRGADNDVTFQEKNNLIHVLVSRGPAPSSASVTAELARERQGQPSLTYGATSTLTIQGAPVVKVSYSTLSPANPVTGKRVKLLVDRYTYAHGGKVAILDLATAKGVNNVDAYKLISRSFRWQ